ncbi:lipoyl(octanoyl) transferase LipB [Amphritea sp. 2_MG-2023]|uniref:lipoyl(octanoyl) transferase LipB n=1 Tax=Amphritea TaxID=515417 RepID=UPI001C07893C|nr:MULTISPECIES: lipoyl(octanoyl) transferase LipB [Amphritea]MBU2967574.1 lipoyl(octanoyl) transferase LipB [Amphritea atlantica]MDO6419062.1 lipoyl(octanoyl) transferase LipB [Amphritea sp. 2_MG-2023]MDX2421092.1 lipoyl(octanoyl) transferase LipB [Amphritea sp.]
MALSEQLVIRDLGLVDYQPTWQTMQDFTAARTAETVDEIWVLEHQPVFTQGQAGKEEHLLSTGDIPVVQVDRGGQVTYHGPGQLVVYLLLNIRRKKFGVKELVARMEASIVDLLARYGVEAYAKADAPGVYVNEAKICSLGLRVRKGCSFHGLAFNLDMDLEPFNRINPCGYAGMAVTRLKNLVDDVDRESVKDSLIEILVKRLEYNERTNANSLEGIDV